MRHQSIPRAPQTIVAPPQSKSCRGASFFCVAPPAGDEEVTGNSAAEGKERPILARLGHVLDERLSAPPLRILDSVFARYKQGGSCIGVGIGGV